MLQLDIEFQRGAFLTDTEKVGESILVGQLTAAMDEIVNRPHQIGRASCRARVQVAAVGVSRL